MKEVWKDMLTALVMGMILPGTVLNFASALMNTQTREIPSETVIVEAAAELPEETLPPAVRLNMRLRKKSGEVVDGDLDTYLLGVVLAEMPASFELEALKAQAVVARTYTRKAYVTDGKHGDGSVCTNPGCCQAYISEDAYLGKGGTQADVDKVRYAIAATSGYVLTYGETLIEAVYFSCSGGSTEDAVAVWGTDYPYLQAVDSPGEEGAAHFADSVTFTPQEFQNKLGVILKGEPASWFGDVAYTEGGGVESMNIGGETYKGTKLRSLLGLRSTVFAVDAGEDGITITTHGYGHRVGMSQYGADAMAAAGSGFREILMHYYPGTTLTKLGR